MNSFPGPNEPQSCTWRGLVNAMLFFCVVEDEMTDNEQWCLLQVIANQFLRGDMNLLRDIWVDFVAGRIDR